MLPAFCTIEESTALCCSSRWSLVALATQIFLECFPKALVLKLFLQMRQPAIGVASFHHKCDVAALACMSEDAAPAVEATATEPGYRRVSIVNSNNSFDLHRDIAGQRPYADSGTRVPARVAEHIDEKVRTTVDHAWVIRKIRRCIDHAEQLHNAFYPAQVAQFHMQDRQQVKAHELRMRVRFIGGDVITDLACHQMPGFIKRPLPRQEQQVAFACTVSEVAYGSGHVLKF